MPVRDLNFDFSTSFGTKAIPPTLWQRSDKQAQKALSRLKSEMDKDQIGFLRMVNVLSDPKALAPIKKAAQNAKKHFDNLVIIGIGGSSLGGRMLFNALANRYHNELPAAKRKGMRLYFLENDDPASFEALMSHLDLKRTLFNVISKSGSTIETACQFVLVRDRLRRRFPRDWQQHLLYTTDPEQGIMRQLAQEEGIATLDVPPDVGGRYSVLTAVGLFPAFAVGMDVPALIEGARRMAERCLNPALDRNPALSGALIHWLADRELKRNLLVMFPYADGLKDWTEWFCQLWAESLGKAKDREDKPVMAETGTTPIKALGAIDQHSQMQLYMEGPSDKVFTFFRVESFGKPVPLPAAPRLPESLRYLAGHTMEELIKAEEMASRFALKEAGRMSYEVVLSRIDADAMGQLVIWAEVMTVLAGYLYNVNPFDQPGVELGKKYAYGLMGRKGFEDYRRKILGK